MASQTEQFAKRLPFDEPGMLPKRSARVLPMNRVDALGNPLRDEASGGRLGPARGLMLGVSLGAALWCGLGLLAWQFFSY